MAIEIDSSGLGDADDLFLGDVIAKVKQVTDTDGRWQLLANVGACEFPLVFPKIAFGAVPLGWISGDVDASADAFSALLLKRLQDKCIFLAGKLGNDLNANDNPPICGLYETVLTAQKYTDKKTNVTKLDVVGLSLCRLGFVDGRHRWQGGDTEDKRNDPFTEDKLFALANWTNAPSSVQSPPPPPPLRKKTLLDRMLRRS